MNNNNKIALITGAGSGIGAQTAIVLAKHSYHTIITGKSLFSLEKTEKKIFNAEIDIYNDHDILIGQYLPNDISGNFSLILERGYYKLYCIVEGENILKKELKVSDFDTKEEHKKLKLLIDL